MVKISFFKSFYQHYCETSLIFRNGMMNFTYAIRQTVYHHDYVFIRGEQFEKLSSFSISTNGLE